MEFLVTVGVAALVVMIGVGLQNAFKRTDGDALDARLGGRGAPTRSLIVEPVKEDWDAKFDRSFENMVSRTGLDLPGNQGLIAVVGAGAIVAGLFHFSGRPPLEIGVGFALGAGAIFALLWLLQGGWRKRLEAQFPDAFYFLARAMRAGLSFDQAAAMAGDKGAAPLSHEMRRMADQLRLGVSLPAALHSFADRVPYPDARALASAVALHREVGGNLAHLLDRLAFASRERQNLRAQVESNVSLAKASALFIGLAQPLLLLYYYLARPEFVEQFFSTPTGWTILAISVALEILGVLWISWLIRESE